MQTTEAVFTTSIHPQSHQELSDGWLLAGATVEPSVGGLEREDDEAVTLAVVTAQGRYLERAAARYWRAAGVPV